MKENEVREPAPAFDAVKARFIDLVERHLDAELCKMICEAGEMLRKLAASDVCQIGFATGGWRRSAIAKLESAGLDFRLCPAAADTVTS